VLDRIAASHRAELACFIWQAFFIDKWQKLVLTTDFKNKLMKPCQTKESTQERERKRNKRQEPKSRQANSPKEAGHKEKREPLRTGPSTSCPLPVA
jgi:hypothetical protein